MSQVERYPDITARLNIGTSEGPSLDRRSFYSTTYAATHGFFQHKGVAEDVEHLRHPNSKLNLRAFRLIPQEKADTGYSLNLRPVIPYNSALDEEKKIAPLDETFKSQVQKDFLPPKISFHGDGKGEFTLPSLNPPESGFSFAGYKNIRVAHCNNLNIGLSEQHANYKYPAPEKTLSKLHGFAIDVNHVRVGKKEGSAYHHDHPTALHRFGDGKTQVSDPFQRPFVIPNIANKVMTHSGAFAREFRPLPISHDATQKRRVQTAPSNFFTVLEVPDHPLSRNHHVKPKPSPKSLVTGANSAEYQLSIGVKEKSGAIHDLCETTVPGIKCEVKDPKRYYTETTDQFRLDSEKAQQVANEKERRSEKIEKGEMTIAMAKSGYADGNKYKQTVYEAVKEQGPSCEMQDRAIKVRDRGVRVYKQDVHHTEV